MPSSPKALSALLFDVLKNEIYFLVRARLRKYWEFPAGFGVRTRLGFVSIHFYFQEMPVVKVDQKTKLYRSPGVFGTQQRLEQGLTTPPGEAMEGYPVN